MKSGKAKQNGKEELRKAQKSKKRSNQGKSAKLTLPLKSTPPSTLNTNSPPEIVIYHVSSLNHPISKEFNQLCAHTFPLW
jgi:hypothetical protein